MVKGANLHFGCPLHNSLSSVVGCRLVRKDLRDGKLIKDDKKEHKPWRDINNDQETSYPRR